MGQLVKATRWIRETFEMGSRPSLETVKEWIEAGEVPGRVINGSAYVDADAFAVDVNLPPAVRSGAELLH